MTAVQCRSSRVFEVPKKKICIYYKHFNEQNQYFNNQMTLFLLGSKAILIFLFFTFLVFHCQHLLRFFPPTLLFAFQETLTNISENKMNKK